MTTIKQPFQCNLHAEIQKPHKTTRADTTTRCKTHRRNNSRMKQPQPHPPHTRGTFHRRLQPLYTEKHKASCSGFLPNSPLAFVTASLPHHFPSSPLAFIITSLRHHFPSSPLPIVTTSFPHHFPSSPASFDCVLLDHAPPFIIVNSRASCSFVIFLTTSFPHHLPSSPPAFLTTRLHHHFPLSPLPFLTTSHRHYFPSSPLPVITTSLPHHFPSSPLPFLTTSLPHHFPSSPASFDYVLLDHAPPFIIVNSRASYSFVMCIVRSRTTLQYC